ncbi:acyl carrier protein [sulfur-oxidizing endosymbiont of Gigantopelta aegis]|uniref:acyl carrier protein n=1 Tax=sulfur-oxidizing endosymbiont of Gigantopelta aegis TaxID=2794934 RepID=UPI0018DCFEE4|nr:acyl carrier protein [sulfur-oxidizing endosymbiont of Gigantopelta aegis]
MTHLEQIKRILIETLELDESFNDSDSETLLLGNVAEFDSMGVISVITALEEQFGIIVEDDDISGDTFETLGTLDQFLDTKIGA